MTDRALTTLRTSPTFLSPTKGGSVETALVLPGGGARTLFASGVILGANLEPEQVSRVYALSTAAPIAAYFAANQIRDTGPKWFSRLLASQFLNWWRLLRFQRPANVCAFIHKGCADLKVEAIPEGKLFVNTLRLRDGATVSHTVTADNAHDVLIATCSFPIVSAPHPLGNDLHMDGGTEETFPVLTAHKLGARKIIAIANRPASYRMEPYGFLSRWMSFPRWPHARAALSRRAKRTTETLAFLRDPPPGTRVLLIQPEADLPAGRLTLDPKVVLETFGLGLEVGRRNRRRLQRFLLEP